MAWKMESNDSLNRASSFALKLNSSHAPLYIYKKRVPELRYFAWAFLDVLRYLGAD